MIFETIIAEGLAHYSYFLGSDSEAIVIDPRRDIEVYLDIAEKNDMQIKYVFETHRNEDYLTGGLELEKATGATILHSAKGKFKFGTGVSQGDKFSLGSLNLEVIETPGHTFDSVSLAVSQKDVEDSVLIVFCGDTIFAGSTARTDFLGDENIDKMSAILYDSIHDKILPLGDQSILCPAHGAGSVCGSKIRDQKVTTIAYEKKNNPMLNISKEEFIKENIQQVHYYLPYFKKMEIDNEEGPEILETLPTLKSITPKQLKSFMKNNAQVIDLRSPQAYAGAHIPETISIWQEGLAGTAGWFLNYDDPIILICDDKSKIAKGLRDLIRIGYDNVYGYLSKNIQPWYLMANEIETLDIWTVHKLKESIENKEDIFLLDVRREDDFKVDRIPNSKNIWMGYILDDMHKIPKDKKVVVYCDSGNKATVVASLLEKNGYTDLTTIIGSMNAWRNAGYSVEK